MEACSRNAVEYLNMLCRHPTDDLLFRCVSYNHRMVLSQVRTDPYVALWYLQTGGTGFDAH